MNGRDWLLAFMVGLGVGQLLMAGLLFSAEARRQEERPIPRLIGHDCLGSGGDLWAMEESDFPTPCEEIEPYMG